MTIQFFEYEVEPMRMEEVFFNRTSEAVLAITEADVGSLTPELCAETRSLSVGMDALCCLPRFSNLQKLVLLPGAPQVGRLLLRQASRTAGDPAWLKRTISLQKPPEIVTIRVVFA